MAIDKIQICNRGLVNLGLKTINSFDDASDEASACSVIWDQLRREVLNLHPWTFATKRADLARSTTNPLFNYAYRYKMPADFLWLWQVYQDPDYKIEDGGYVLTSKDTCFVKYIYDNNDPSSWSADFCGVMSTGMAKELAYTFPRKVGVDEHFEEEFAKKLSDAQGRDSIQQIADDFGQFESSFITARFSRA